MRRCRVLILDAGPFNSLWVANALELLLKLDLPITLVDAVYDEMTSDLSYAKDADVKAFVDNHRPPFHIVETAQGLAERERRARGEPPKRNAGEVAMADFLTAEDGLDAWLDTGEPVLILTEDMRAARRLFLPEARVHVLGTIGLLRGMERMGMIASADAVLREMRKPSGPGRFLSDGRTLSEPPEGLDVPAQDGSFWTREM